MNQTIIHSKICSKCKIQKTSDCFTKHPFSKTGLQSWCKECYKQKYSNREIYISVLFKTCTCCKQEKNANQFRKQKNAPDGLANYCITCVKSKQQERYYNDHEYREKTKQQTRIWMEKHPEKIKQSRERVKQNTKSSPWMRIKYGLRKRLANYTKFSSKVGLPSNKLKIYLETLFTNGVSWENYGEFWEVVKIKPIQDFDLTSPEEVAKINHYTNLQIRIR